MGTGNWTWAGASSLQLLSLGKGIHRTDLGLGLWASWWSGTLILTNFKARVWRWKLACSDANENGSISLVWRAGLWCRPWTGPGPWGCGLQRCGLCCWIRGWAGWRISVHQQLWTGSHLTLEKETCSASGTHHGQKHWFCNLGSALWKELMRKRWRNTWNVNLRWL